jgi:hypothetical protein
MAASVVKSCDLDHKPNHSGPGFITAPPSPHDSDGCERAIFRALCGRYGGAASIGWDRAANRICSLARALHGRPPYLRGHGNVTVPVPRTQLIRSRVGFFLAGVCALSAARLPAAGPHRGQRTTASETWETCQRVAGGIRRHCA